MVEGKAGGPPPLVGVRFSSLGPVEYCVAQAPLAVGELVQVGDGATARLGILVIAAEQIAHSSLEATGGEPAVRAAAAAPDLAVSHGRGEWADGGALGALGALVGRRQRSDAGELSPEAAGLADDSRLGLVGRLVAGLDAANRHYLARKVGLPALGQTVSLDGRSGEVIVVDVRDERVTIRLADGTVVERQGPSLAPAAPRAVRPPAGRRHGRGRRRGQRGGDER